MTRKKITHIIYDMDGLLLDTEPFYTQVTQSIVQEYGKEFNWTLKSQMMGKSAIESARFLVKALDLPITPEAYLTQRVAGLEALYPSASALPGAMALTEHFKKQGIAQAVATSSYEKIFNLKTMRHKTWFSLFDCIIMGDNPAVKQSKPAPDIFLAAAQCLKAKPEQCLVFEDAPAGVAGALAAGMSVVAVPDPQLDQTLINQADQIINGLDAFSPKEWGLP
jgi:HAD superfamily hydrolase (TIGR01509 family)